MTPQGWCDVLSANLDKSPTSRAVFSVARHARDGLVDDEMRRRMRLLVPHVRRSAMIGKLINLSRVEAAAMADTLDGLQAGMFLVDAAGRLVHANASGRAMLNDGNVLHANGRLVAPEIHADEVLSDVFVAAGHGDAALAEKGVAARLTARDGDQFVTHVLPLTSGTRRQAGVSYAAVAAVFVQKAGQDPSPALRDAGGAIRPDAGRVARAGRAHGLRRRRRGRGGAEAVARDGAHASAPCVREDRRAAPGRSHQADGELSGADPGAAPERHAPRA